MKLYNTKNGIFLEFNLFTYLLDESWDTSINRDDLETWLKDKSGTAKQVSADELPALLNDQSILPPIAQQEVWAAGVTYLKSRDARMEESQGSGAASLYDMVYDAERPELFFKSTASRVSGHGQQVYIRLDSSWNVPEPELVLFINAKGTIQG